MNAQTMTNKVGLVGTGMVGSLFAYLSSKELSHGR
jgi:malate/lactate dehydrogenase